MCSLWLTSRSRQNFIVDIISRNARTLLGNPWISGWGAPSGLNSLWSPSLWVISKKPGCQPETQMCPSIAPENNWARNCSWSVVLNQAGMWGRAPAQARRGSCENSLAHPCFAVAVHLAVCGLFAWVAMAAPFNGYRIISARSWHCLFCCIAQKNASLFVRAGLNFGRGRSTVFNVFLLI